MFFRFKKSRRAGKIAAAHTVNTSGPSANFGLFGVYVKSLPHLGR